MMMLKDRGPRAYHWTVDTFYDVWQRAITV